MHLAYFVLRVLRKWKASSPSESDTFSLSGGHLHPEEMASWHSSQQTSDWLFGPVKFSPCSSGCWITGLWCNLHKKQSPNQTSRHRLSWEHHRDCTMISVLQSISKIMCGEFYVALSFICPVIFVMISICVWPGSCISLPKPGLIVVRTIPSQLHPYCGLYTVSLVQISPFHLGE